MAGKIFINYRRDDSISTAGRLHDRLAQSFGRKNLFMDVDHIPAGVDFVDYLPAQVAACDIFLAVIGPDWLDAKDDDGKRRLDNPDDFVTIEIAAAAAKAPCAARLPICGRRAAIARAARSGAPAPTTRRRSGARCAGAPVIRDRARTARR